MRYKKCYRGNKIKSHRFRKHPVSVYKNKSCSEFQELGQPVKLWDGWCFDGVLIHDDAGNRYNINDIKRCWQVDFFLREKMGDANNIHNLKTELKKRVALNKPPKVCLMYEQPNGDIIEKVFNLVEED